MNDSFEIGERLRELRLKKGLSQEQIANMSTITTSYYGQVERGAKNITVKALDKLCKTLDITLSEFFYVQGSEWDKGMDDISIKIMDQLVDKTEAEKQIVLNLITLAFSIKKI